MSIRFIGQASTLYHRVKSVEITGHGFRWTEAFEKQSGWTFREGKESFWRDSIRPLKKNHPFVSLQSFAVSSAKQSINQSIASSPILTHLFLLFAWDTWQYIYKRNGTPPYSWFCTRFQSFMSFIKVTASVFNTILNLEDKINRS